MKTAKKMFEKLDYLIINEDDEQLIYQKDYSYQKNNYKIIFIERIIFNKNKKAFYFVYENGVEIDGTFKVIDMNLLKAINQQVKELGWDEN